MNSSELNNCAKQGRYYRQMIVGTVVSDRMNKTRVIEVERVKRHKLYHKNVKKIARIMVHDEKNESKLGDVVSAVSTRPLSARKHFRIFKILKRVSL